MASVDLKFIFANHDGVSVTIPTSTTAQVSELKRQLIEQWPSGECESCYPLLTISNTFAVIEQCDDTSRIRFLCMGCGELKDGNTLGSTLHINITCLIL